MRTVYREKRYVCGEYQDVYIFPVFDTGPRRGRRAAKRKPSTEAQKKLNKKHREQKLTRLLHANFTPKGLTATLTYTDQPGSDEEAMREAGNFLRRVKRYAKKHGLGEIKYIIVTERGARSGKYHHHIAIEFEGDIDRDALEKLWTDREGHGFANTRRLQFTEEGLEGLAKYISKSPVGKKAWTASRNLVDPDPKTRDERISGKKARELADTIQDKAQFEKLYPGYTCGKAEVFHNDHNGGCYLEVRLHRADGVFIKPKGKKPKRKRRTESP